MRACDLIGGRCGQGHWNHNQTSPNLPFTLTETIDYGHPVTTSCGVRRRNGT